MPDYQDTIEEVAVDNSLYGGGAYPFTSLRRASRYVLDFHLSSDRPQVAELQLSTLSGIGLATAEVGGAGTSRAADLQLRSGNAVWLDTAGMSLTSRQWHDNTWVYVWRGDHEVLQVTIRRDDTASSALVFSEEVLDPRSLCFRPQGVTNLRVGATSAVRSDGTVKIRAGYNMLYRPGTSISRRGERRSTLELAIRPGAGLGSFPACNADLGVTGLGGASPTVSGNLSIRGDDCISFEPALTYGLDSVAIVPGKFVIRDDCEARCSCEDFASVANYAIAVWNNFRLLADRAIAARAVYHEVREKLVTWGQCSQANPLKAHAWRAEPCGVGFGFGISNVSDVCLPGLSLTLTVKDSGGALIAGSLNPAGVFIVSYIGTRAYSLPTTFTESGGTYTFVLNSIKPGQVGFIFARFELPEDACSQTGVAEISLVGDLPDGQAAIEPVEVSF